MWFPFLRIVKPTWYFHLSPRTSVIPYIVDYDLLNAEDKSLIKLDTAYSNYTVSKLDAAYQALNKGIIEYQSEKLLKLLDEPTIKDNYRFLKKYFHPLWSWYVLLYRILSLYNPIVELKGFISSHKVGRVHIYNAHKKYLDYESFQSPLLLTKPKVTVVIPTLNRYRYLQDVLKDLEKQTYENFDVIIVDQSTPFNKDFYTSFKLHLQVFYQEECALWLARNTAIKKSDASYILLFDDDSRVDKDWIYHHIKVLDFFKADISSGVSLAKIGSKIPDFYSFFKWSGQIDTGNVMLSREIFKRLGLFDRQFEKQRLGDGEFGLRAMLAGYKNISNYKSQRVHLKVSSGGLRQMGSWDAFRTRNVFAPKPVPSVLYFFRKYFGNKMAIRQLLISSPPSIIPYRFKKSPKKLIFGVLIALMLSPILLIQTLISWRKASKKLQEGPLIEDLK